MSEGESETTIDPELLTLLCCPVTGGELRQEGEELVSAVGGLRYPIRDGLPVLLRGEAKLPEGFESMEQFEKQYAERGED